MQIQLEDVQAIMAALDDAVKQGTAWVAFDINPQQGMAEHLLFFATQQEAVSHCYTEWVVSGGTEAVAFTENMRELVAQKILAQKHSGSIEIGVAEIIALANMTGAGIDPGIPAEKLSGTLLNSYDVYLAVNSIQPVNEPSPYHLEDEYKLSTAVFEKMEAAFGEGKNWMVFDESKYHIDHNDLHFFETEDGAYAFAIGNSGPGKLYNLLHASKSHVAAPENHKTNPQKSNSLLPKKKERNHNGQHL